MSRKKVTSRKKILSFFCFLAPPSTQNSFAQRAEEEEEEEREGETSPGPFPSSRSPPFPHSRARPEREPPNTTDNGVRRDAVGADARQPPAGRRDDARRRRGRGRVPAQPVGHAALDRRHRRAGEGAGVRGASCAPLLNLLCPPAAAAEGEGRGGFLSFGVAPSLFSSP